MISNKVLTIEDAIEIFQKAKEEYGNLPLEVCIGNCEIEEKRDNVWDVKDIIADNESVTIYNY